MNAKLATCAFYSRFENTDLDPIVIELFAVAENALGLGFDALTVYSDKLSRCDYYSFMTTLTKQNDL